MDASFFYGLEPRWTRWDRMYKIFVLPHGIAGAYLAGQVYDEASGRAQVIAPALTFGPLLRFWVNRIIRRREEREDRYRNLSPGSTEFMAADPQNFTLSAHEIQFVTLGARRSPWTWGAPNAGSIEFVLGSGHRRSFILIGEPDIAQVERNLVSALGPGRVQRSASDVFEFKKPHRQ